MLLRIEIGEQLIRYTPPGRPNRTDFATFAREVSSCAKKSVNCENCASSPVANVKFDTGLAESSVIANITSVGKLWAVMFHKVFSHQSFAHDLWT